MTASFAGPLRVMGIGSALVLTAALCSTEQAAHGQAGGSRMIMVNDSGEGDAPRILHFSMPDIEGLRRPDFTRRDLPTFCDKLVLSEAQAAAFDRLINDYLEAFVKLADELLPAMSEPIRLGSGAAPQQEGAGEGANDAPAINLEGLGDIREMLANDPELKGMMPEQIGIGVDLNVNVNRSGDVPDDGQPQAGVAITFEGPEGQELSEETRKKLETALARVAEKMQEKLQQQLAEQRGGGGGAPGVMIAMPGGVTTPEELEQRHAELAEAVDRFRDAKARLRQQFVADAQSNLIAEQVERWPALERTLYRQRSLPEGRLSGECTDLVRIVDDLGLTSSQRDVLRADLEAYELALDHALRQRDAYIPTANKAIDDALQQHDPDKALDVVDRATDLRKAVRSINQQYAQLIESKLPAEHATAFTTAVRAASYPNIYGLTRGQRVFAAAKKIEDLQPKALEAIDALERSYALELESMNETIRRTIDEHEPQQARRGIERLKSVMQGERMRPEFGFGANEGDDPIAAAFARRRELDERYEKSIHSYLTPEQIAQLPKPPARRAREPIIIRTGAADAGE